MGGKWHERLLLREGWGVFLLTLALVGVVSAAVADAGWTGGMNVMTAAGLGAFGIGFLIARSRLSIFLAHIFSLTIGFAWAFRLATSLFPAGYTWLQRWAWMWYRIYLFGLKMAAGGSSDDSMVFILQMALLVWLVTYLVVWSVFRNHRVWQAVILSGLLFLGTFYYSPRDLTGYFVVYVLVVLLLLIRFNLYLQEQVWRRAQVQFNSSEITFDFWRAGLALSLLIVALAWLAPAISLDARSRALDALRAPWYDLEERWSRLFTSLNYRPSPGADFSGQQLSLGGPRLLSDTPVLEIRPSHNLRYWREVALDRYTGHGWVNSHDTTVRFGADYAPIAFISYQSRLPVSHTATVLIPNTAVLALAAQPEWVSLPARARLSFVNEAQAEDVSYARSRLPFRSGDTYTVSALQSTATVAQLRAAGDAYPEWTRARYLQLPEGLPDRVRQLSYTVTSTSSSAYDRAAAVESYLRREIAYNDKIEAPPVDRDAVDYLLFDTRQGYCDYYASAMVVMLRTQGIPARVAAGYAQGEYRTEKNAFVVRQEDAHAWPEVFFPDYGWVTFNPASQEGSPAPGLVELFRSGRWGLGAWQLLKRVLLLVAFGVVGVWAASVVIDSRLLGLWATRRRVSSNASPRMRIALMYEEMCRRLAKQDLGREPWQTVGEHLQQLRGSPSWRAAAVLTPAQALSDLLWRARYSPHPVDPSHVQQAREHLGLIRRLLRRGRKTGTVTRFSTPEARLDPLERWVEK